MQAGAVERNSLKQYQAEFSDPSAFLNGAYCSMLIASSPTKDRVSTFHVEGSLEIKRDPSIQQRFNSSRFPWL